MRRNPCRSSTCLRFLLGVDHRRPAYLSHFVGGGGFDGNPSAAIPEDPLYLSVSAFSRLSIGFGLHLHPWIHRILDLDRKLRSLGVDLAATNAIPRIYSGNRSVCPP